MTTKSVVNGGLKGFTAAGPIGSVIGLGVGACSGYMTGDQLLRQGLEQGDLIEFDTGLTYRHWALYVGNGDIIHIQLPSGSKKEGKILRESLKSVCDEKKQYVRKNNQDKVAAHFHLKLRSKHEILQSAQAMVGKEVEYGLLNKNCEYYCTLWRYGTGFSAQVSNGMVTSFATLTMSTIWGGLFGVLGFAIGGPIGAGVGYTVGSAAIGGGMTAIFEGTGTTHNIQHS